MSSLTKNTARKSTAAFVPPTKRPRSSSAVKAKKRNSDAIDAEMMRLAMSKEQIIPKSVFMKVVKEIMQDHGEYMIRKDALEALQEICESHIEKMFLLSGMAMKHANRKTLLVHDIKFIKALFDTNSRGTRFD